MGKVSGASVGWLSLKFARSCLAQLIEYFVHRMEPFHMNVDFFPYLPDSVIMEYFSIDVEIVRKRFFERVGLIVASIGCPAGEHFLFPEVADSFLMSFFDGSALDDVRKKNASMGVSRARKLARIY